MSVAWLENTGGLLAAETVRPLGKEGSSSAGLITVACFGLDSVRSSDTAGVGFCHVGDVSGQAGPSCRTFGASRTSTEPVLADLGKASVRPMRQRRLAK